MKVSIIIPVFNEEKVLHACLASLKLQTYKNFETIVIDDGSLDKSSEIAKENGAFVFAQAHKGPGPARNLGATNAKGQILAFLDADMTFDKNFLKELIEPIVKGKAIGTFSKNEYVSNPNNIWSVCWNINKNLPKNRMIPEDYPKESPVFRAILKEEFDKAQGFDTTGEYTDDWSLSRKLSQKSKLTEGAVYYHKNPSDLSEIYQQARWIGKNSFISGSNLRKFKSLILFNPFSSLLIGIAKALKNSTWQFIIFKIVYDFGIFISVLKSFSGELKYK